GDEQRQPGRPKGMRSRYQATHPAYKHKQRAVRSRGHNNLLNFIGKYFPRRDDPDNQEFYFACMLVLLKPWRNLRTDLRTVDQSWS
ncbi:hypothetical protein R3P38DRAFT_2581092, partial [Favolaschia claudopus]